MSNCIVCNKPADKRISPDLDIKGIPVCNEHADEIKQGLIADMYTPGYFEKKYLKRKKNK